MSDLKPEPRVDPPNVWTFRSGSGGTTIGALEFALRGGGGGGTFFTGVWVPDPAFECDRLRPMNVLLDKRVGSGGEYDRDFNCKDVSKTCVFGLGVWGIVEWSALFVIRVSMLWGSPSPSLNGIYSNGCDVRPCSSSNSLEPYPSYKDCVSESISSCCSFLGIKSEVLDLSAFEGRDSEGISINSTWVVGNNPRRPFNSPIHQESRTSFKTTISEPAWKLSSLSDLAS